MSTLFTRIPHLSDVMFIFFASQLGIAVQPGPKTQAFLRQTLVSPILIMGFILIKNAQYTSREAMVVAGVSLVAFYLYRCLP